MRKVNYRTLTTSEFAYVVYVKSDGTKEYSILKARYLDLIPSGVVSEEEFLTLKALNREYKIIE